MERIFPLPPLEKFVHGAVWFAVLDPVDSRGKVSWDEIWMGPKGSREHLVLISAAWREWPRNDQYAGWWRSRLVVGDLGERKEDEILRDFRRLVLQTPPVQRNWRKDLTHGRYDKAPWHLTWVREVTRVM